MQVKARESRAKAEDLKKFEQRAKKKGQAAQELPSRPGFGLRSKFYLDGDWGAAFGGITNKKGAALI